MRTIDMLTIIGIDKFNNDCLQIFNSISSSPRSGMVIFSKFTCQKLFDFFIMSDVPLNYKNY